MIIRVDMLKELQKDLILLMRTSKKKYLISGLQCSEDICMALGLFFTASSLLSVQAVASFNKLPSLFKMATEHPSSST